MKLLISFLLFITMPYIIYCVEPKPFAKEIEQMDKLAKSGTLINEVIRLKKKGFLGRGSYGFVYEGITWGNNCSVAVKFTTEQNEEFIQNEFQIYQYLDAYQNPLVERFGIPMVHHYGKWGELTFLAVSLLTVDLSSIKSEGGLKFPINVLIFLRNFVIQSKYMHSKGVRHDDIKPGNIMVHGHQSFLIDFNLSARMAEFKAYGTYSYASRRFFQNDLRHAVDDWESFLHSMCRVLEVPCEWFHERYANRAPLEVAGTIGALKSRTGDIQNLIDSHITNKHLKPIFNRFAAEVYDDSKPVPNYDDLERLISKKIMKCHDKDSPFAPTFTWLTDAEKEWAMKNPLPNITSDIREPADIDFKSFDYSNQHEAESSARARVDEDHESSPKQPGCFLCRRKK